MAFASLPTHSNKAVLPVFGDGIFGYDRVTAHEALTDAIRASGHPDVVVVVRDAYTAWQIHRRYEASPQPRNPRREHEIPAEETDSLIHRLSQLRRPDGTLIAGLPQIPPRSPVPRQIVPRNRIPIYPSPGPSDDEPQIGSIQWIRRREEYCDLQ